MKHGRVTVVAIGPVCKTGAFGFTAGASPATPIPHSIESGVTGPRQREGCALNRSGRCHQKSWTRDSKAPCGRSSIAESLIPNQRVRVQFPSSASLGLWYSRQNVALRTPRRGCESCQAHIPVAQQTEYRAANPGGHGCNSRQGYNRSCGQIAKPPRSERGVCGCKSHREHEPF